MNYSINPKERQEYLKTKVWIYSVMVLYACNSEVPFGGEAVRLYFIAKAFNTSGDGWLNREKFITYLTGMIGFKKYNVLRWLNSEYGKALLPEGRIISYLNACELIGVDKVIQKTDITIKKLIGKNWKSYIFRGFCKNIEGYLMSRTTKEKITGVKTKTQRAYEKKSGVKVRRNYAVSNYDKQLLTGFKEHVKSHAFINRDVICWGLPNTVKKVSGVNQYTGTWSRNRLNRSLSVKSGRMVRQGYQRVYLMDKEQVKEAERKADFYNASIQYLKAKVRNDTGFFHAVIL